MEPWLGYTASAISVIALVSREAMTEVSLSDMEEMLRKQGRWDSATSCHALKLPLPTYSRHRLYLPLVR